MIVRGIGPSLTAFGVSGALSNPTLNVYDSQGQIIASNDDWKSGQQAAIQASTFAPSDDRESAVIVTLPPGSYTAVLSGVSGEMGVGLLEAFDLDTQTAPTSRPINVSARAHILTGDNVLIGGFMISGTGPKRVIVRAVGPSLAAAGVQGPLADPVLALFDGQGHAIATNDNWRDSQQAEIAATPYAPSSDAESAILMTLSPGSYTVIVSGKAGSTGVGLIEVFELP